MPPRVLILRAPGTNCDQETAYAFEVAGGRTQSVHVNRLLENPRLADEFQILCLPGGFSYGDDIAAGRILGNQIRHHLADAMQSFKAAGKLILGICNGFQILIKSGLLLEDDPVSGPAATLVWNASGKFEDRWVRLNTASSKSVFLAGVETMYLPVAHAEGKFVARDEATLAALDTGGQLALRYAPLDASPGARADADVPYPANPNGSPRNVAGVCDATGRVFGLMPHPERHIDRTHHPRWTRGEGGDVGDGLKLFQNSVAYFAT
ncbi:MAG: phosphoribosylformylglycinamidine synthase I [Pirellulales bacterium]